MLVVALRCTKVAIQGMIGSLKGPELSFCSPRSCKTLLMLKLDLTNAIIVREKTSCKIREGQRFKLGSPNSSLSGREKNSVHCHVLACCDSACACKKHISYYQSSYPARIRRAIEKPSCTQNRCCCVRWYRRTLKQRTGSLVK